MGCVYKITNIINNKIYIGYTTRTLEKRFAQHLSCAEFEHGDGSYDDYFKKAIRKYGKENFKPEVIEYSDDKNYLQEREKYWIQQYNSYAGWPNSNGYNLTTGGQGGNGTYVPIYAIHPVSLEIVDEFSSISEAYSKYGETVANVLYHPERALTAKGITFIKQKDYDNMSSKQLKDFIYNRYNIICQLDPNGRIIQYFFSPQEAAMVTGISTEIINRALRNETKHAGTFQWCYYKNLSTKLNKKIFNFGNNLAVGKIVNNQIVEVYKSAKEAGQQNNCDASSIGKVCKGKRKTCGGFQWCYIIEE